MGADAPSQHPARSEDGYPVWLLFHSDRLARTPSARAPVFIDVRKRDDGETDDDALRRFMRGATRSAREAKRHGYSALPGRVVLDAPSDRTDPPRTDHSP